MTAIRRIAIFLTLALGSLQVIASPMSDLSRTGTQYRLLGNFEKAAAIEAKLIAEADDPIGHIFALNTIVTHLTWDETKTTYDEALLAHAGKIMDWCEARTARDGSNATAHHYCGQASFALAFHHGLKGQFFKAGQLGTRTIEYLESALTADPDLIDAKMHLGVAYHVADNLPPFIKMFSRFLWFIPSGNSEKSLPYLLDVIEHGDEYPDVARYIYSTLLMEDAELRTRAVEQLQILVNRYPENPRFQLRLISLLLIEGEFEKTLQSARSYLHNDPIEPDLSLVRVWMARAYLGLGNDEQAHRLIVQVEPVFRESRDDLPGWSVAWHMLTDGQLHDLRGKRQMARETYAAILALAKSTYVNQVIIDAARSGLLKPYRLTP